MAEVNDLALEIIKTIEKEDEFYEAKKNGGFVKRFQAKEFDGGK